MKQTKLPKRTLWYPGDMKPHRKGVYEMIDGKDKGYQYWNGEFWGLWSTSPDRAVDNRRGVSTWQNLPWRGLEEKAK
jgi:hypothetical protein